MRFLKSLFFKIKAKITLKTYRRPLAVTLLTLLFVNLIVLLIGAAIALEIDYRNYGSTLFNDRYLEAFIASIRWMISPNSLLSYSIHDQWQIMVLAAVIVVIGMVLFSGAIIATVTTALRAFIDTKSKARGQILIANHFVILNWNAKVPDLIYNLMVKGFKGNIVILSQQEKAYIESEIKSLLLSKEDGRHFKANLIIKEGDTLLRSNLEDISIERASQIVVMARDDMEEGEDENIHNSDLLNLKIVLRLASFDISKDCQIVVETISDETRGQIENLSYTVATLKKLNLTPVSFNRKIGQIIAQSLIMPRISDVYAELFSFEGSEFYSIESEESIDEFMKTHDQAIPVFKDKRLFVLACNDKQTTKTRHDRYDHFIPLTKAEEPPAKISSVFVIGDNSKSEFLIENLRRSQETGEAKFKLRYFHKNENAALIEAVKATPGPKKILILSDDQVGADTYDANVFVSLIELSKAFPNRENLTYITELLDSRNLSSVRDFNIKNTIISNKMMSLLISQLAMNKDAKVFFERVLSTAIVGAKEHDFDILISPASQLLMFEEPLHFSCRAELLRSFYEAFDHESILFGMIKKGGNPIFLNADQDKPEDLVIEKDDLLIYMKYL